VLPYCKLNELGARLDAKLLHHAVLVKLHRPRRDVQHVRHLFHRMAFGEQLQHFTLARCELMQRLLFLRLHERTHQSRRDERRDV
jgi:hypothetical protein